ncbi:MAG: GNAT family N-acetyltransferase [Kineosporiaceae bacterium]
MTGTIRRDAQGIPYLWGDSADELAFVQGRAVALDRAWQLEVERWRSVGGLAARLGHVDPAAWEWDAFARRIGLDALARSAFWALDPPTRRWVRAFVTGVNDGLAEGAARAPEFADARCAPGRWLPWTPLGVLAVQHALFGPFGHELWRAHLVAALGGDPDDVLAAFSYEGAAPAASGSNAVAVAPSRSATGRPLLAADPHRLIEAPGVYQQVGLACPEFDVVGLAFPGVPGVQHVGHTGAAAWVVTNAMARSERLVPVELRRTASAVDAGGPDGVVAPVGVRREVVEVRGGAPVPVDVTRTPWGPVVVGAVPSTVSGCAPAVVLATPERGDLGFSCLLPLLRSRSAGDVEAALAGWVTPVNSVLVASSAPSRVRCEGNNPSERTHPSPGLVRRLVAGRVVDGPVRGLLAASDVDGLAVCANDRRPGDTAEWGDSFAPPHRARRLRAVLGEGRLSVGDLAAAQVDTVLGSAPVPVAALRRLDAATLPTEAAALRERLLAFDGRMDAGSVAAGEFAAWRGAVVRRLAEDRALRPLMTASAATGPFPSLFAPWLDPLARIGDALESLLGEPGARIGVDAGAAARAALLDAVHEPARPWGATHRLAPLHVLGAAAARYGLPDVAVGGDGECVLATSSVPGRTDRCARGPVARVVWDVTGVPGEFGDSRWVVPLGADGAWPAPHARDQTAAWVAGGLVPVAADRDTLDVAEKVDRCSVVAPEFALPREPVHVADGGALGPVVLRPLRPVEDAALLHGWVTAERARFWGMTELSVDDVVELYAEVDALDTHDALLIEVGGLPAGLLQTYTALADPISEVYDAREGDVGIHLFLAPVDARPPRRRLGLTRTICAVVKEYVVGRPGCRRIVAEPDAANHRALALLERIGFSLGEEVALPHKRARMAYLVTR